MVGLVCIWTSAAAFICYCLHALVGDACGGATVLACVGCFFGYTQTPVCDVLSLGFLWKSSNSWTKLNCERMLFANIHQAEILWVQFTFSPKYEMRVHERPFIERIHVDATRTCPPASFCTHPPTPQPKEVYLWHLCWENSLRETSPLISFSKCRQ